MNVYMVNDIDKERLVFNAMKMYKDSIALLYEDVGKVHEGKGIYSCLSMKDKIERILETMRLEYVYIIRREFLEGLQGKYYENYFSDEEYLLYKKGAIDSFLHCLYGDALL